MDKEKLDFPGLNQYYAAFVISSNITPGHLCPQSNPCPQRGCKYCCPSQSTGDNPSLVVWSLTLDYQFLSAFSLPEWPPLSHSLILCVYWVLLEGSRRNSYWKMAFAFCCDTQIKDIVHGVLHMWSQGRDCFMLVNDVSL